MWFDGRCMLETLRWPAMFVLVAGLTVPHTIASEPSERGRPAEEAPASASRPSEVQPAIRRLAPAATRALAAKAESEATEDSDAGNEAASTATHHQTGLIQVNTADLPQTTLKCFCLTPDGRVLAGCEGASAEIRVFNADGEYVETWSSPVTPEAINVRRDGMIYVAGGGEVAKLDAQGNLVLRKEAPHAKNNMESRESIRDEVVKQLKQRAEQLARQGKIYDQMIEKSEAQIAVLKKQMDKASDLSDEQQKAKFQQRLTLLERMKTQYESARDRWNQMSEANVTPMTDEQIEEQVKAQIQYKMRTASISAVNGQVFIACPAAVGYTYDVWKMDDEFENAEKIVSDLRGCCGQMDVQVNEDGVFVAENSRHRVSCYDAEGKEVISWGHGSRTGLDGFGGCCNPMNVAFGPNQEVYTAESESGRIKRYSPDGKLLGLVGSAQLVPGCKKVAIAVNEDASRVYMLDITRNHIVMMDRYAPGEAPAPVAGEPESPQSADTARGGSEPNVGKALVRGISAIFQLGK